MKPVRMFVATFTLTGKKTFGTLCESRDTVIPSPYQIPDMQMRAQVEGAALELVLKMPGLDKWVSSLSRSLL